MLVLLFVSALGFLLSPWVKSWSANMILSKMGRSTLPQTRRHLGSQPQPQTQAFPLKAEPLPSWYQAIFFTFASLFCFVCLPRQTFLQADDGEKSLSKEETRQEAKAAKVVLTKKPTRKQKSSLFGCFSTHSCDEVDRPRTRPQQPISIEEEHTMLIIPPAPRLKPSCPAIEVELFSKLPEFPLLPPRCSPRTEKHPHLESLELSHSTTTKVCTQEPVMGFLEVLRNTNHESHELESLELSSGTTEVCTQEPMMGFLEVLRHMPMPTTATS